MYFDLLKAIGYIEIVVKRPILVQKCAICSELPPNISTMGLSLLTQDILPFVFLDKLGCHITRLADPGGVDSDPDSDPR